MTFFFDKNIHQYKIDNKEVFSVTQILTIAGLSDFSDVPEQRLKYARVRGEACHKATELKDKGILDYSTLDERISPYLNAWEEFKTNYNVHIKNIELPLGSIKYQFGGTIDRVAIVNGKLTIIDIKATATISPVVGIQLAGYQLLWNENNPKNKAKNKYCVQLKKNGFKVEECKNKRDEQIFLSCLSLVNYKKERGLIK